VESKEGRPYIKKGRNVMFVRVAIPIFWTRLQMTKKFVISKKIKIKSTEKTKRRRGNKKSHLTVPLELVVIHMISHYQQSMMPGHCKPLHTKKNKTKKRAFEKQIYFQDLQKFFIFQKSTKEVLFPVITSTYALLASSGPCTSLGHVVLDR
jgi:hypothetical protein